MLLSHVLCQVFWLAQCWNSACDLLCLARSAPLCASQTIPWILPPWEKPRNQWVQLKAFRKQPGRRVRMWRLTADVMLKVCQVAGGAGLKHWTQAVIFCCVTQRDFPLLGGGVAAGWFGAGQGEWTHSAVWDTASTASGGVCGSAGWKNRTLSTWAFCDFGVQSLLFQMCCTGFWKSLGCLQGTSAKQLQSCIPLLANIWKLFACQYDGSQYLKWFLKPWITSFWKRSDLQLWLLEGALCAHHSWCVAGSPSSSDIPLLILVSKQGWGLPWEIFQKQSSSPYCSLPVQFHFLHQDRSLAREGLVPAYSEPELPAVAQPIRSVPTWLCLGRERSSRVPTVPGWSWMETCP